MRIAEWLEARNQNGKTNLEELSELVTINAGFEIGGFGFVTYDNDVPYGRVGLEQEEMYRLIHMTGVIAGFYFAEGAGALQYLRQRISSQVKRDWPLSETVDLRVSHVTAPEF